MRLLWVPLLAILSACQTVSQVTHSNASNHTNSVPSVLDTPVEFTGPVGSTVDAAAIGEIRLGLFAPTSPDHPVGRAMFEGAQLAVDSFNSLGGIEGVPLSISTRWDADPWRGGSKEMIKLVYEDSVLAVIGSVDGEATHVAEQVVTKAWLPLLSPVSADPTLTYIRIPWIFRLPPNDEKQAAVLLRDGINANSLSNVGLITSVDHDGRIFGREMLEQMAVAQKTPAFHLQVSTADINAGELVQRAEAFQPDAVIVRLPARHMFDIIDSFEADGIDVPLLIPWIPGLLVPDLENRYRGTILYVAPYGELDNQQFADFRNAFLERYGAPPTPSAAYTYDAVSLIVRSVREAYERSGGMLNRGSLRDALSGVNDFVGVTGPVSWDNAGGNRAQPVLEIVKGNAVGN